MYSGYNFIFDDNGDILYSAVVEMPHEEDGKTETVGGIRIFRGKWNAEKNHYQWESPAKLSVSKKISGRGLMEPFLAKLKTGVLYLDMRGSTHGQPSGVQGLAEPRHWCSSSKDGGNTWEAVSDLKFDTGEQFWAPSSFAKLIRSSKNGKLFWIGNISLSERPDGNWPRMPLYIAEFDEDKIAIKKDSLTVIDNKESADICPKSQYSNFSLLENRDTGTIELYLTRYGEKGKLKTPAYFEADVFKYEITLK
jgi:hypothetical protein